MRADSVGLCCGCSALTYVDNWTRVGHTNTPAYCTCFKFENLIAAVRCWRLRCSAFWVTGSNGDSCLGRNGLMSFAEFNFNPRAKTQRAKLETSLYMRRIRGVTRPEPHTIVCVATARQRQLRKHVNQIQTDLSNWWKLTVFGLLSTRDLCLKSRCFVGPSSSSRTGTHQPLLLPNVSQHVSLQHLHRMKVFS